MRRGSVVALVAMAAIVASLAPAGAATVVPEPVPTTPAELYQQRFVWFYDSVTIEGTMARPWRPYRGKYRAPLDGADFYRAIDREDLASRYDVRRGVRIGLMAGGFAALGGGFVLLVSKHETAGVIVGVGGLLTAFVGGVMATDPISESEARFLADQHNKALKAQLNLGSSHEARTPRAKVAWHLFPSIAASQASLTWVLAF